MHASLIGFYSSSAQSSAQRDTDLVVYAKSTTPLSLLIFLLLASVISETFITCMATLVDIFVFLIVDHVYCL